MRVGRGGVPTRENVVGKRAFAEPANVFVFLVLFLPQASATVAIPKEHHRFVIGKNGEKLQDLELKTATKIQIPRPDDASNQIRITGTKEGIEKARHEVLLISAEQVWPATGLVCVVALPQPPGGPDLCPHGFRPSLSGQTCCGEAGSREGVPPLHRGAVQPAGQRDHAGDGDTHQHTPAQRQPDRDRLHGGEGATGSGCGSRQEGLRGEGSSQEGGREQPSPAL